MQFEKELNTPVQELTINANNDILFGDYIQNQWLKSIKPLVEITTYSGYENKVKIIAKYFNNLKITLKQLKTSDIKKFYNYLMDTRNITYNTVKRYHACIHKSLEDAIQIELIENNVARNIKHNKVTQYIASLYNQAELETLFNVSKNHLIELHILLASYYGLRREEICRFKMDCN